MLPGDVIAFWQAAGYDKWFTKDEAFDAIVRAQFLPAYEDAAAGRLASWEATADGALALLILLDQMPRNIFRGDARAFAADEAARAVADAALARGFEREVPAALRPFFFLPFMHSEHLPDQERSVGLYQAFGDAELLKFAEVHADIIRRFGRFPHRNAVLGRATTAEEQAFLDGGGFKG